MKKNILALIVLAVFVSGCVGQSGGLQFLQPITKEKSPDVILTTGSTVIPTPPVQVGDSFSVSFQVQNQDDTREVSDVNVLIYDTGTCRLDSMNEITVANDLTKATQNFGTLAPGSSELVELKLTAPSNAEVGGLTAACPISYKVSYKLRANTQIDAQVITTERLKDKQRTGTYESFQPTQNVDVGPIKIYFEYGAAMPIETGKMLPITIKVQNKGQGDYAEIPARTLSLSIPSSDISGKWFVPKVTGEGCNGFHIRYGSPFELSPGRFVDVYENTDKIPMIKGESTTKTCYFTVPSGLDVIEEKTYLITADMDYDYGVSDEISVAIKPSMSG